MSWRAPGDLVGGQPLDERSSLIRHDAGLEQGGQQCGQHLVARKQLQPFGQAGIFLPGSRREQQRKGSHIVFLVSPFGTCQHGEQRRLWIQ